MSLTEKVEELEKMASDIESNMKHLINQAQISPEYEIHGSVWDDGDLPLPPIHRWVTPTGELADLQRLLVNEYEDWYWL